MNKKHIFIKNAGTSLSVKYEGNGPLVLFVHGFPEACHAWDAVISLVDKQKYTVATLDMRGYGASGKPSSMHEYHIDILAGDVAAVIRYFNLGKAIVVAHDWGGFVGWRALHLYPELFEKYIVLGAPHPAHFPKAFLQSVQVFKSWYVFLFQIPWAAEIVWKLFGSHILRLMFESDLQNKTEARRIAASHHSHLDLRYPVKYYRKHFRTMMSRPGLSWNPVNVPVLVLWGTHDKYLAKKVAIPPHSLIRNSRVEYIGKTHWLHHEEPQKVALEIQGFAGK